MIYKWHGKDISFIKIWNGSNSMFHNMDGIKEVINKESIVSIPKYAMVFMFKVNKHGKCYLGVPYNKKQLHSRHFTHVGWKTFSSQEERLNALENVKWMYRVIPNHPGQIYIT